MDKFGILVSYSPTITSLLINFHWNVSVSRCFVCSNDMRSWVLTPQVCSIRNCSFGEGVVKWRVKFETKKKKHLIDGVSNKKIYRHSCDLILESLCFWERSELSRIWVIWLNLSIEKNPTNVSRPWKIHFQESAQLLSFFLATGSWQKKTTIDTSEPYTGVMRGTMHEHQANLGAYKKFSPGRFPATRP